MELGIDNILTDEEIETLFSNDADDIDVGDGDDESTDKDKKEDKEKENDDADKNSSTTETYFDGETDNDNGKKAEKKSESVGSSEDIEETGTPSDDKAKGSSPNNFYTSITRALVEDGVLDIPDESDILNIKDADGLREAISKQIASGIDAEQKRIADAINGGAQANTIQKYKNTLGWLNSIKEEALTADTKEGRNLRKTIIFQDYINKGFSEARAERELKKSFEGFTDIDDAKEALASTKEYFQQGYDDILQEIEDAKKAALEEEKKNAEAFRKSILGKDEIIPGLTLDDTTRKKIFDNATKPTKQDKNGQLITELAEYQEKNKEQYLKIVSTLYTITKKFTDFTPLVKQAVQKERKKGLAALEDVINNTQRNSDGSLNLASGVSFDDNSYIGNFKLNI
jgi:hypothetical protein